MRKELRIRKNEEFSSIMKLRNSNANKSFVLYYAPRKLDHARAGISVSKKLGDAVDRNRIKRQVRAMLLKIFDFKDSQIDIIVIVRNHFLENDFETNQSELEKVIKKAII